jgi:V8-like Glu-specific endopeptidase
MSKNLLFAALLWSGVLSAQSDFHPKNPNNIENLPIEQVQTFDHNALLAEDSEREKMGQRSNHGRVAHHFINMIEEGVWSTLSNGDQVCQLRFESAQAKAVCAYFQNLWLPEGTSVSMYSPDLSVGVGPYTSEDCAVHGRFRTASMWGSEAILEYYQPASAIGSPTIEIRGFGHFYRFVDDLKPASIGEERGGSEWCEVDVNCPEGAQWTAQRDAVVRLEITEGNFVGLCTGSLVNNTEMDCRKYVLTALHCGVNASANDLLDCVVRFNYERSGCGAGSAPTNKQKIGVIRLADSDDNGGDSGSDFMLLEMEDDIPASWDPFFAGWNAATTAPQTAVGIHHPSGDSKKISTTQEVVSGTWSVPGYHWRVEWMETVTNWGVTEGGSSGSPLYNPAGQVVGTLTGGGSFCNSPTQNDFYGKMDRHWDDNPNSANQKLKVWLDPDQSTVETQMLGSYMNNSLALPCSQTTSLEETVSFEDVVIFPTAANDFVQIYTTEFQAVREVRVFDAAGAMVRSFQLNDPSTTLDVTAFASGMYYITFIHNDSQHLTKKFNVVR